MLISKMNRFLDRHGRTALVIIAVAVIIPFLITWAPGDGGCRGRESVAPKSVGTMYGKPIKLATFSAQVSAVRLKMFLRFGRMMDDNPAIRDYILEDAMRRLRGLHEARERGLAEVSEEDASQRIREMFSMDGSFNAEIYRGLAENVLPSLGMTEVDMLRMIQEDIALERLEAEVMAGVYVTPLKVRTVIARELERFTVAARTFREDTHFTPEIIDPNEAAIAAYFEANSGTILLPAKKRIRVAIFPFDVAGVTVTDEEISAYVEENEARFEGKELGDVRAEVRTEIASRRARIAALTKASSVVGQLSETLSAAAEDADPAEAFKAVCEAAGVKVVDSGPFTHDMPIPNIGAVPSLQMAAYSLDEKRRFTQPLSDQENSYIGCWCIHTQLL